MNEARSSKRSIVIVDGAVALTGGLRCAARTARLLAPWADTTLVLSPDARVDAHELAAFGRVVRMPVAQLRKSPVAVALYPLRLIAGGWRLRRLLRKVQADALIVNDFFMAQGAAARALGFRGRVLTWVRIDPKNFPDVLSRAWLAAAYRGSNAVVAVSDFIVSRVPPHPKLVRIYDSIDLDLPDPAATPPPTGPAEIVCVANFIAGKGQTHAIDAFAMIATEFPDARLGLFGGDMGTAKNRAYLQDLRARAAAIGFGDRIAFNGFATDLASVMARATVALVLSESESFSLTCLEASQLGVPVIAFRSGGPAEIVVDGETGFLCDVGDTQCVASALRTLLSDREGARAKGMAGAVHVRQKFGPEPFVARLRGLLGF